MNDYEARKAAKAERFRGFADNARARSTSAHSQADQISKRFEAGQPIILNHHSTRRALKDRERMDSAMRKSIDEHKTAEYWERRARAVEMDKAIERHDPEAQRKLTERIEILQGQADRVAEINKWLRAHVKPMPPTAEEAMELIPHLDGLDGSEKLELAKYIRFNALYRGLVFPTYHLSGLRANLRRYQQRLKEVTEWQNRSGALEVVNRTRRNGEECFEFDNGWAILRDRSRRNEAQYRVVDDTNAQIGEHIWSWRLALSEAERYVKQRAQADSTD